ncbi:N-formylglutamate amidohydrolase [Thalassoglobus sp. JC818]|uniref:N-formylglutamate amidohydrolase n=1 Tax=Thalassoglobus sp. JC818 TaxID=3232136 RepID=UPI00345B3A7B
MDSKSQSSSQTTSLIVSCEHGGNELPEEFAAYFSDAEETLATHRGLDLGALAVAEQLAKALNAPLHFSTTSRLLIDLNRSPNHPDLFSQWSRALSDSQRTELIAGDYTSYRSKVESSIREITASSRVIHLSIHSFTPIWNSVPRSTDIGLLFDPSRQFETDVCTIWKQHLINEFPDMTVDDNQPYLGTDDGLTTYLRTQFSDSKYAGIELEVNQKLLSQHNEASTFRHRLVKATSPLLAIR